jgi:hypothetical protein
MENYNMLSADKTYSWVPVIHYQSAGGFYSEMRYNYEDERTISLYAGKKIFAGRQKQIELLPMAGLSAGKFSGFSLAFNAEVETGDIFLSVETQYSFSFKKQAPGFLFNWSEAGFNIGNNFFAGSALQTTIEKGLTEIHPGVMAGFVFGNFIIPVYLFKPFNHDKWLQIGINYEHIIRRKKSKVAYRVY